jgi:signal transduction histidine kinase
MPALLLGLGLAVTIVLTGIVEVLGRRRRYAERLVAERTQDLRDSLEQLERAQQQVVLSERLAAIGQVASTVGHELRNPLGVVANAAYLIRLRTTDTSALRQLDTLDREVQSAARISSDLLDFARVRTPEWTDVDVHALISEVLSVVPHHGGVTITRDEDRDLGSIRADPDQLRQVLLNLVTNACEALPEGGTVTVAVHRVDGAMRIDVADTGLGMDEVTQARLFEPFFTTKTRGTGLGLAVCKRLVDAHGGSISVVSARGEGTRFTVNLPRVPTAARPPTDAPATAILGTHE